MSQTKQQEQGAAAALPKAGRHWELFWRIIAGLMVIVIAWVVWVLYQITPRSVVTPLAYEAKTSPIAGQRAPAGVSPPPVSSSNAVQSGASAEAVAPRAAVPSAVDLAMEQAQAAVRGGAHQSSADVQAAEVEKVRVDSSADEQKKHEGLKLSTEISTPLAGTKAAPGKR